MSEEFDPETLKVGDRVHHADCGDAVYVIAHFQAYPLVTLRSESGAESSANLYYLTPAVEIRERTDRWDNHWYALHINGQEYDATTNQQGAQRAAQWWKTYLSNGGHPLTDEERQLRRRDTDKGAGITFREELGGFAYLPDSWVLFQGGWFVRRYRTLNGAMRRVERIRAQQDG